MKVLFIISGCILMLAAISFEMIGIRASLSTLHTLCNTRELPKIYDKKRYRDWSQSIRRINIDEDLSPDSSAYKKTQYDLMSLAIEKGVWNVEEDNRFPFEYPSSGVFRTKDILMTKTGPIADIEYYSAQISIGPIQRYLIGYVGERRACSENSDRFYSDLLGREFKFIRSKLG